ncbi:MAG: ATPase domain-containing protein, partial [Thermoplasmata archaeon]
ELTDNPQEIESILESLVEKYSPKRMVIDPITPMLEVFKQHRLEREFMHRFFSYMKTIDCVTLITSEISYESIPNVLESYMVDGIILLSYPEEAGLRRKYLEILKMRGTKHTTGRQLMDITQNGIVVHAGLR